MVTPLKKRRLANYKEDQENAINEQEETIEPAESPLKAVPNGLKKQILQNQLNAQKLLQETKDMQVARPTLGKCATLGQKSSIYPKIHI